MSLTIPNTLTNGTNADASKVKQNFDEVASYVNTNAILKDASVAFTGVPSGPATDPTTDNQLARKAYVDAEITAATATPALSYVSVSGSKAVPGGYAAGDLMASIDNWSSTHDPDSWNQTTNLVVPTGADGTYLIVANFYNSLSPQLASSCRLTVGGTLVNTPYVTTNISNGSYATINTWMTVAVLAAADTIDVEPRSESTSTSNTVHVKLYLLRIA